MQEVSMEDVILWPDNFWCYREELHDFNYRSDDYEVIYYGTLAYANFFDMLTSLIC